MCGIVAVIDPTKMLAAQTLNAMRDRLQHRGPDGAGSWTYTHSAGLIGLAHRRLSILDLSEQSNQPMFSADGRLAIVFNGEIYNYVELAEELKRQGCTFKTRSDTEVLLTAYAVWGVNCLERLNGMFAFAIWDANKEILFVARDRLGEKPLFFTALPGNGVAFASEIKALFAHPAVEPVESSPQIAAFMQGSYYEDGADTTFAGIKRFAPAHAMVLTPDGKVQKHWRYWTPIYQIDASRNSDSTARFRELMTTSVRMRLRSDVPVGTSLSGGLDSSFIVCLLAKLNDNKQLNQNCFSARFEDDPTISEGTQIDEVVARAGVRAHAVAPDPNELAAVCAKLHWHQEEPFPSASIFLQWKVMELAKANNTTVLLDGQGADELLAGYAPYFQSFQLDMLEQRSLLRLASETRTYQRRATEAARAFSDSHRRFNSNAALTPRQLLRAAMHPPAVPGGYSDGVPAAKPGWRLKRQLAIALQYNCLPALLRYADRNSMAFSREVRLPFLDYNVIDFAVTLPNDVLIRDGWQKHILRQAGEGILPPSIQWRFDKVGYAAPLDNWLRRQMKDWARERLFDGPVKTHALYDKVSVQKLWNEHQSGAANHSWQLWRWVSLGEWLQLLKSGAWKHGV